VIVLSNGTLLYRPDVRRDLLNADSVKISLSAWDEASFQKINRPAPGLSFEQILEGEREFRAEFKGNLWMEVFLMEWVNADFDQVEKIAAAAAEIRPDKIHLNTAVRPPAESDILPVAKEKLEALCGVFTPRAEVIASFSAGASPAPELSAEKVIDLIRRHPATAAQLAQSFGVDFSAILPVLDDPRLEKEVRGGEVYYKCR
jgi:wyosine [tRNA(Phe)-imidazoG37] synthetase (radical SAM superfamily)